jgi:hypothetical protein
MFAGSNEGEDAVMLGSAGPMAVTERELLLGAVFLIVEGGKPLAFQIVGTAGLKIEAVELLRKRSAEVVPDPAPSTTAASSGVTSLLSQSDTADPTPTAISAVDQNPPPRSQPRRAAERIYFSAQGLECLWLANGVFVEGLVDLSDLSLEPAVAADFGCSMSGEPVLKLSQISMTGQKKPVAQMKLKLTRTAGAIVGGVGESAIEKTDWNVPVESRKIFTDADAKDLFEGKERVMNVQAMYTTCMLAVSVGAGESSRFDVDACLFVHLPHGELQMLLKFRFPGIKFFQKCQSEKDYAEYVSGIRKADEVPEITTSRSAVVALEQLIIILQRIFSKCVPVWEEAWAKLLACSRAMENCRSLPGMDHNGLLSKVLDRVLAGVFRVLSKSTVSAVEVLACLQLMCFDHTSVQIKEWNKMLSRTNYLAGKSNTQENVSPAKRSRETTKVSPCFQHFAVESVCRAPATCQFTHDIGLLKPEDIQKLKEHLLNDGKTPIPELL